MIARVIPVALFSIASLLGFGTASLFAAECSSFSVTPSSITLERDSLTRVPLSVTPQPAGCTSEWTVSSQVYWLQILSALRAVGPGTVTLQVTRNYGPARTGFVTVAGASIEVKQPAVSNDCHGYKFALPSLEVGIEAGSRKVDVRGYPAGCTPTEWSTGRYGWVDIEPRRGSGDFQATISWEKTDSSFARSSWVSVDGDWMEVIQAGIRAPACLGLRLSPSVVESERGAGSTAIVAEPHGERGCQITWNARSDASWVRVSPASGIGGGTLQLVWDENPQRDAREATVTIGTQKLVVRQKGSLPDRCPSNLLCLSDERFELSVEWKDFDGRTGRGVAENLSSESGYFWFFDPANVELVVKVVDGRPYNGHWWVFYGALSNVEYTLTVRDRKTGAVKTYVNPAENFASSADTSAFPEPAAPGMPAVVGGEPILSKPAIGPFAAVCASDTTHLCLNFGRFRVSVAWQDPEGRKGEGIAVPLTGDTGYFWFFDAKNAEVITKVLDGRAWNQNFWFFYGSLSNVEYTVTVVDVVTGSTRQYRNPAGVFGSVGDTEAFR
jgi:hypothetical protein